MYVYFNFRSLSLQEDGVECESFIIIFINFLRLYGNKYYLQVYLDNRAYKIIDKKMIDYLDDNLSEFDKNYQFFNFDEINLINVAL